MQDLSPFYENAVLKVDAALRRGDPGVKLIAARRSAPTLPARPAPSSAVVT